MKCSEILFDSNIDNWNQNTSVFNERIIGKKQLAFVIEDKNDEIFGYYLNTEVVEQYKSTFATVWQETDNKSFLFNLQSKKIRKLNKPMKF